MPLVEVAEISGYFTNLMQMYQPSNSESGDPLYYLVQDHWQIFNDDLIVSGRAARLLDHIMMGAWDDDDGEPPVNSNELYVRRDSSVDYIEQFEAFLDEARETEDAEPAFPDILSEDIWRYEQRVAAGAIFYRARVGFSGEVGGKKLPWEGVAIGPNPVGEAGRANRRGKVVLYCADRMKTAIAEVRPARGLLVSVAEVRVIRDINLLDLVRLRSRPINPFLEEGAIIPYWLELDDLLYRFGWQMAKPLERNDNPLDYVPSQRLSELAAEVHFDGIRYPSAMHRGGENIVLFNPAVCEILQSRLVKVTDVELDFTDELWQLTDDFPEPPAVMFPCVSYDA